VCVVWRIHFTSEDMLRTRIAPTLGPLAETMFGLRLLGCAKSHPPGLRLWREQARTRLHPRMRPLAALAPQGTLGVDLWTLTGEAPTIEAGIEALRAMRPEHVKAELEVFTGDTAMPRWAWQLTERDGTARRVLAESALVSYHALLQPLWPQVRQHLNAERAARGRALVEGGLEGLFTTLHPRIHWRSPVLEISFGRDWDLCLSGRGLTLVPSLFIGDQFVLLTDLADEGVPPKLIFPAPMPHTLAPASAKRGTALAKLLGHNRATVLTRIADGCTTSELANRAGVSLAAASQHATVLREAGLITTRRNGGAVFHSLTSLGEELLAGQ
jgi:DNA-binding transcriptional ArsR family regulator